MFSFLKSSNKNLQWLKQLFTFVLLLASLLWFIISLGCQSTSNTQHYSNSSLGGLDFDYPSNWELKTNERLNNWIAVESKKSLFQKDTARVEITWGGFSKAVPPITENSMAENIDRIRRLYDLESVTVTQLPSKIERNGYELITATITIPTTSIPKDSSRNQVGDRDLDVSQTVDIYIIRNHEGDIFVTLEVYKGNSEELNTQAQGIVNSLIEYVETNES